MKRDFIFTDSEFLQLAMPELRKILPTGAAYKCKIGLVKKDSEKDWDPDNIAVKFHFEEQEPAK